MNAKVRFLHQHVRRFLDANAVAVGQMLPKHAFKGAIDENDLHLAQQWGAATSYQKAMAAGPSAALAGNTRLASTLPSTKRLRPLRSLSASKPTVCLVILRFLICC
ncbi:hypothetical protein [Hymenobacter terrenus]|uniref:hypothetical protein n=1 Tax=Hymenobacter terrenus TaxID=1629124 RepID=UPI000A7C21C6|nr:hypothetical protein [Hymenobacter terrenus]